jgi:hypothetical protein
MSGSAWGVPKSEASRILFDQKVRIDFSLGNGPFTKRHVMNGFTPVIGATLLQQIGPEGILGGLVAANLILPHHRTGKYLLYPFSFLATWVHEMGHVLAAYLSGGKAEKVELNASLGGQAKIVRPDTVSAALLSPVLGLLGPVAGGSFFIYFGLVPGWSRSLVIGTALLLFLTAFVWIRNIFGFAMAVVLGGALLRIGAVPSSAVQFWTVQALGVRLCVESISDFTYLYTKRTTGGRPSDTQLLSRHLFMPYWIWGTLIAMVTIGTLGVTLYFSWGPILLPPELAPQ